MTASTQRRRRPRVALVSWEIGGPDQPSGTLASVVLEGRSRVDFVVVSSRLTPELRSLVEWRRVPAPKRPFRLRWAVFFLIGTVRLLGTRADLVHTSGPMPIVANRVDLATVHFCHAAFHEARDSLGKRRGLRSRLGRALVLALERWCYGRGRTRVLAAVSEEARLELGRHYPRVETALTPLHVDTKRFRPDPVARAELRAALDVPPGDFVAIFVGRDWELKGLAVALEGFALAEKAGGSHLRLWVLGRDARSRTRRRHRRLAGRRGLAGRVEFFGFRTDIERFYQAADVLLLPTLCEMFCRAAHEAASCELPVVVTRVSGVGDLVGRSEAGVAVERDARSVAAALCQLTSEPALRGALGRAGRERALLHRGPRWVESVLEVYDRLLTGHAPESGSWGHCRG